jgi:hypothetical protein
MYELCGELWSWINSISDDIYGIDEVTIFNGEWSDKTYAVAGDVLDGVSSLDSWCS